MHETVDTCTLDDMCSICSTLTLHWPPLVELFAAVIHFQLGVKSGETHFDLYKLARL